MLDNMSMQKRMIFATVLSILFFVVYTAIFPPEVAKQPTKEPLKTVKKDSPKSPSATAEPSTTTAPTTSSTKVNGNIEATLVDITAPTFTMQLDALGRISSKKLLEKQYVPEGQTSLEIISNNALKPLEIRFRNTALNEEAFNTPYETTVSKGEITADKPLSMVLTQKLTGVTVSKKLTFYADGHYDVDIALDNQKGFTVSPGFQPNINLDGFTLHGVSVEQSTDILTIIEDGEAEGGETFKGVKLATAFDRYYGTMFYTNKADLDVILDKTPSDDPMLFIEGRQAMSFSGYVGQKSYKNLHSINPMLVDSIEYGFFTFIATPVFWLLNQIHTYVGNWGWAIVVLTILIRLVLYPLSYKGMVSMHKLKQIAPQMKELQKKHKGDPQKLNAAMMALYKKEGANPLGGCLPMLLQLPVFFAIYRVLLNSVEMQGAPWALWINDLAVADPYYILPLLMGGSMWYQQHITPTNFTDPMQEKMMKFLPIIMTGFFVLFGFPAGLVLYWTTNNIATITQQSIVNAKFKKVNAVKEASDD